MCEPPGGRVPLRLVLVGWGAIGRTVARSLEDSPIEIVGIGVRDPGAMRQVQAPAELFSEPDRLRTLVPDVVAEAAGVGAVEPWGRAAFGAGADFIVSSVAALADAGLYRELRELATANGARLHIQPGALGGVDALAAAALLGIDEVEHRIIKPPRAWAGTPAEGLCDLAGLSAPQVFFEGTAVETATTFPKNANVAMTTALAGIGPDATRVALVADPTATTNRHEIRAHGAFGALEIAISNQPLPDNPKTSAMAALNLVRTIRNRANTVVI